MLIANRLLRLFICQRRTKYSTYLTLNEHIENEKQKTNFKSGTEFVEIFLSIIQIGISFAEKRAISHPFDTTALIFFSSTLSSVVPGLRLKFIAEGIHHR